MLLTSRTQYRVRIWSIAMKRYILVDLNDTETFDTLDEAKQRMDEWIDDARQNFIDSRQTASEEQIARWNAEEDFYAQRDDIAGQIRLYEIDLDVYEGDKDWPDEELNGCERIETFEYRQFRD